MFVSASQCLGFRVSGLGFRAQDKPSSYSHLAGHPHGKKRMSGDPLIGVPKPSRSDASRKWP